MGPQLEALVNQKATVRLRKIDIDEWSSPVARAHDIRRLPTLALYDGKRLVSKDPSRILTLLSRP